jgi:hypothetical protein
MSDHAFSPKGEAESDASNYGSTILQVVRFLYWRDHELHNFV